MRSADRVDEIAHVRIVSAGRGEGDGWANWSELATLLADVSGAVSNSLGRLAIAGILDSRPIAGSPG
jgi:hypothetical protein